MRFSGRRGDDLSRLDENGWKRLLAFCDRAQLTLPLGLRCRDRLPGWVRSRIEANLANNATRWEKMKAAYREAASAYQEACLEFLVLKGFTHCPDFAAQPCHRPQYDIDMLFPRERLRQAREITLRLGYESLEGFDEFPIDHLPTMIRKTGWEWRGDCFDTEIPVSLELHFRLWDPRTEGFAPSGLDEFWERRQSRELDGLHFLALQPEDAVGYASLHMIRHLLRGDLRAFHVYELAWLLDRKQDDAAFWNAWFSLHDESLRRIEAICFGLAHGWFDCGLPAAAEEAIGRLPGEIRRWLEAHAESPLIGLFRPNKDDLWLHWHLLSSPASRVAMLRRRLLPGRLPGPVDAVHLRPDEITWRIRVRRRWRYAVYVLARAVHHSRALPSTAWSAARWFGGGIGLKRPFWRFFIAAGFFDFGLFVFFLLYNVYLLRLGFRENFLGLIAGMMTAGSVAATIPAALALERFGIRKTLLGAFTLVACLSALRAWIVVPSALLALAFAAGAAGSVWAVAISPAVAGLTNERNRSAGFSLVFSSGIAIGAFGGLAGGRLPGWLQRLHPAASATASYLDSLLLSCGIVLLALIPLSRTSFAPVPKAGRKIHRPSPLLLRFLVAMAVWNLGTGAFNPFFNVFFVRLHFPMEQIGSLFSAAQLIQAGAVLLAPLALRKFGLTRGISGMELATALAMVCLAYAKGPGWAAGAYIAYMAAQYMSEPGMYTLLMDRVSPAERNSSSALTFLVVCAAQAVAAAGAGALLDRFGYAPVLIAASLICAIAAILFRALLPGKKQDLPADA